MNKDNLFFIGIALIALGILGIFFSGYLPSSWWGSGSWTGSDTMSNMMGGQGMMGPKTTFSSNGERIYYTATSDSGQRISASMGGMTMPTPMMSCVDCHGRDGKGGKVQTPMGSFKAHNITNNELTKEENPPYTDELIKRAVTEGLDHKGKELKFFMPRWSMADEDINDLIDYLKTLD